MAPAIVSARRLPARLLAAGAAAVAVTAIGGATATAAAVDAVVEGHFTMQARITTAVNVRGEHRGERLTRTWGIVPSACTGNVCQTLQLTRQRGANGSDRLLLHR